MRKEQQKALLANLPIFKVNHVDVKEFRRLIFTLVKVQPVLRRSAIVVLFVPLVLKLQPKIVASLQLYHECGTVSWVALFQALR
jgi:hypothetical protein